MRRLTADIIGSTRIVDMSVTGAPSMHTAKESMASYLRHGPLSDAQESMLDDFINTVKDTADKVSFALSTISDPV